MSAGEERVREQVARWRDDLLDLTARNRLLRFRHTRTASLEIDTPGAQEIVDRLTSGRARDWTVFVPEDEVPGTDVDPTAARLRLGPADRRGSNAAAVVEALGRLGSPSPGDPLWVSFGALRWQHAGSHTAALYLVPAELVQRNGWRLRLRAHELTVNPALLAHLDREFGVDLGEDRYRVESAGIKAALQDLRAAVESLDWRVDDRIGLIGSEQRTAMEGGELDVTPPVLLPDGPREGVLAGLTGAGDDGLPLLAAGSSVLGVPVRRPSSSEPMLRTTKATGKDVRAACAGLSRRAAGEFMDRGIWVLYLGVGMLHWSDPADGRPEAQDSPLLLIPVRLDPGKGGDEWKVRSSEEEALVNPALWLKVETELGIELPELDPEEPLDVASFLDAVRTALASHPEWTVEERVVLSTFSFHKEAMYRDLRDNFEQIVAHPTIAALARDPSAQDPGATDFSFEPVQESRLDDAFPPEQATTILDADASQRQCIAAARDGRSFVMDGPPGTGKSQTIANMIAELIADGKTILFVSEKAAALDVVHNRLAHAGLDDYVLELHSHKTTRSAVASALGASLVRRPKPNPSLAEHELNEAQRRREALSRYAQALNDPSERLGGRSLHHLLGWIAELQHLPQAPVAARGAADVAALTNVRELGQRLRSSWEVVERGDDFVWRGASAGAWNAGTEQRAQAALDGLDSALGNLRTIAEDLAAELLLDAPSGPHGAEDLLRLIRILGERPEDLPSPLWPATHEPERLAAAVERAAQRARDWHAAAAAGLAAAGPRWQTIADPEASTIAAALDSSDVHLGDADGAVQVERLGHASIAMADMCDDVRSAAADLAAAYGLRSADIGLGDAEAVVSLTAIAAADPPLPRPWLATAEALDAAGAAVDRLAPLLEEDGRAREAAQQFEPSVLELDLDGLAQRFAEVHRGLKKLGGAYREDRDAIAATAPGVKPKAAVAAIDSARAWKTARQALDTAAEQDAGALADAWAGPDTDVATLRRCRELADEAYRLTGARIADANRFADTVSGRRSAPGGAELTGRTDAAVARLRSEAPEELTRLLAGPLDQAAQRLREVGAALAALASLTQRVDAVRGTAGSAADALAATQASARATATAAARAADTEALELLGHWADVDVAPEALERAHAWSREVADSLPVPPSRAAAERLIRASVDEHDLRAALDGWRAARDGVLEQFVVDRRGELADDFDSDFEDAEALSRRLRDTRGDIETWIAHAEGMQTLGEAGLGDAVAFCTERRLPVGQVVDVLRRSVLEATADELLSERGDVLGPMRSIDRDRLVREYASLDRKVVADAAHRVMRAANQRRPNAILGVAAIIANEAEKRRRHMPVAHLLAKTAPVAQAVKPCFMMSPLSVSQFLSPDMRFDVVVFDEASQVRPCDAVNAIYRADAMIVAGDQKQLPPTSFFEQTADAGDEWTEEALADFDSVLDLAKGSGTFRALSLRWHYRSRHEHLIAFSNHRFYGGELVTFPSPTQDGDDLGVQLIGVDGTYRRGTSRDNPVEAQTVADRVFTHAERGSRSIGVVAFSEAQASLIEEALRRDPRRDEHPELFAEDRLSGLFVKNLENVQGDERDIIIFSIGYGPDEFGKLTMNFGPINREGGWRRLNVAITRARRRVEVVCSFAPERIDPRSQSRGVTELRRYLDFAARGPAALALADTEDAGGEPESPFEDSVIRTLRSWGHDVVAQVGTAGYRIDMAVRHPDKRGVFALGIECDGAMYHSSRVARDRDRLREQVLTGLGWTLHRIWGPSWYRDRPGEERRLREAIERSLLDSTGPTRPAVSEPPSRVRVDFEELALDAPPDWTEPYVAAVLPPGRAFDMTEPSAAGEIRHLILQTVTEEAPIVEDLIARRVVDAWGDILTEKRRRVVTRLLRSLVSTGTLVSRGNAFCLPNQRIDLVRVPRDDDDRSRREVKHVPDVELAEAISRLVAEARVVDEEEALQRTARLFGWRRNGPAIQAALERVLERLADENRVERENHRLRAVGIGSAPSQD